MKTIPLTKGAVAIIDDEDYKLVSQYRWRVLQRQYKNSVSQYAYGRVNGHHILMHRLLNPSWKMTDHIDGYGLNNRRSNLRECNINQNQWNQVKYRKNTSSKYKGVDLFKETGKWRAKIKYLWTTHHLGYSCFEIVAARVYDYWAKVFHGEFANLNNV